MKSCPVCASLIEDHDKFCPNCGFELSSSSTTEKTKSEIENISKRKELDKHRVEIVEKRIKQELKRLEEMRETEQKCRIVPRKEDIFYKDSNENFLPSGVEIQAVPPSGILKVSIMLPSLIDLTTYFEDIKTRILAIDYIYSLFLILSIKSSDARNELSMLLSQKLASHTEKINKVLVAEGHYPLRVLTTHYGSPASFDLLGIGKIVEILRETIKDISWRDNYEKQRANNELLKDNIAIEKELLDIASKKIELFEKMSGLTLPEMEKNEIGALLKLNFDELLNSPISVKDE